MVHSDKYTFHLYIYVYHKRVSFILAHASPAETRVFHSRSGKFHSHNHTHTHIPARNRARVTLPVHTHTCMPLFGRFTHQVAVVHVAWPYEAEPAFLHRFAVSVLVRYPDRDAHATGLRARTPLRRLLLAFFRRRLVCEIHTETAVNTRLQT